MTRKKQAIDKALAALLSEEKRQNEIVASCLRAIDEIDSASNLMRLYERLLDKATGMHVRSLAVVEERRPKLTEKPKKMRTAKKAASRSKRPAKPAKTVKKKLLAPRKKPSITKAVIQVLSKTPLRSMTAAEIYAEISPVIAPGSDPVIVYSPLKRLPQVVRGQNENGLSTFRWNSKLAVQEAAN